MARYEDYIKEESDSHEPLRDPQGRFTKSEGLIEEIEEAREQQEVREEQSSAIPERFQGKSAEEIAQSYLELEKLSSRQANDLGAMRKQVDQLLELQTSLSSPKPEQSTPEKKPVTMDDLYDDPEAAIRRIVGEALGDQSKRVDSLEQNLQQTAQEQALARFEEKHPNYREIGESPEFVNWVMETPYRQRLGAAAGQGDLMAADDLLSLWKDVSNKPKQEAEDKRQRQLRDASLESSERSGTVSKSDTFSRSKLLELKIAAKRGDDKAQQWLAANEGNIQLAYQEGRVVD